MGKLPGKTEWAGRRRPMTRTSGFSTTSSGSRLRRVSVAGYALRKGQVLTMTFELPRVPEGDILGFGTWYAHTTGVTVSTNGFAGRIVLDDAVLPDWSKFGSQWYSDGALHPVVRLEFRAEAPAAVALYGALCGQVAHQYLETARPELMNNMHALAPEANFIDADNQGRVKYTSNGILHRQTSVGILHLKSCNRCGRYLPVNLPNERAHLSFTNHCVAQHRRPCRHTGFGKLSLEPDMTSLQLDYGFQLECRFCKKFEVNAAHNPQRTAGQMKEDAARRRAFELLLENLYEGT